MRQRRRSLNSKQQANASRALWRQLLRHPQFIRARHIALYIGNDGELDPAPFISKLAACRKSCYLPMLNPVNCRQMTFYHFRPNGRLRSNRFGIPEPDPSTSRRIPASLLALVLLPLVAFDRAGNRLGMGGGFYDRVFATTQCRVRRPQLIGIAHHFQEVDELVSDSWDVALDGVITDRGQYHFQRPDQQCSG